tara:strand:+ start:975 stop:1739 length:765 start_codon:yes stop_codon:yes gene_type:complete
MKLYYIWILLIAIFAWSCSNGSVRNEAGLEKSKPIKIDRASILENALKESNVFKGKPCIEIQKFVEEIERIGWISDTNRVEKVGFYKELNRKNIEIFNDRPFYRIDFENSDLYDYCKYEPIEKAPDSNSIQGDLVHENHRSPIEKAFDSVDIELFHNAISIWAYFYREKDAKDWISDGIIKQWEFVNSQKAKEAMKQLEKVASIMYFNTRPYYYQIDNKVIIFHTRAMAFSLDQKKLFDLLRKKEAPNIASITQ